MNTRPAVRVTVKRNKLSVTPPAVPTMSAPEPAAIATPPAPPPPTPASARAAAPARPRKAKAAKPKPERLPAVPRPINRNPTNRGEFMSWLVGRLQADGIPLPSPWTYAQLQAAVASWLGQAEGK